MTLKSYFFSDAKFLKLNIPVPYIAMLQEAQNLKNRFTGHREYDGYNKGWKSLSLFGLGEDKHESWEDYGYTSAEAASNNFVWTPASDECPEIMKWLRDVFPCNRFGRVRLMLVEAGGFIGAHSDTEYSILENINIPLSNPEKCVWKWGDGDILHMIPGEAYAMNISYVHSVVNNSNEDRFHIIIARHDSTPEWVELMNTSADDAGILGKYVEGPIAT